MKVLRSISTLAHLPQAELAQLECEEAMWLTGWSRGKEVLSESGEPDFNKGSYYVNCAFHGDASLEGPRASLVEKFPSSKTYTWPNIWPRKDLSGLETFETDCKELCSMIISVAGQVARNCDVYISATSHNYEPGFLQRIVEKSTCSKARLLHYYPIQTPVSKSGTKDSWCGEHTDHSCLTGLTSALYIDEGGEQGNTEEKASPVQNSGPDPDAGLYIRSRKGETVKVTIPPDCLAFQSGAALQEISSSFRAVSHYVRGAAVPHVARNTLAVFCQPDLDEMVNERENFAEFASRILQENHNL
ncbi:hypothetical protein JCM33374_g3736 [Metschnikowia sp. JCM 33374]|nr:hypothetical protein JCM33374_g3736 [Metschnikowia sp. JCM 33374]